MNRSAGNETRSDSIRILVTGGGTGGHVSPALAVVQTLRDRADSADTEPLVFQYIGSETGIEARLAREAGIEFVGVKTGKLRRARNPFAMVNSANLRDLFRIPVGIAEATKAVRQFRPDVLFATGGYVSVPPVIAAASQQVPILTHEQTVQIGLANRIAGVFATRIALSFAGSADELPVALKRKSFVTGNPVRKVIFTGDRARALSRFGFGTEENDLPTVYVTGGAQGARIINQAVGAVLPDLLEHCRLIHQCGEQPAGGEQDFDRLTEAMNQLPSQLRQRYYLTRFVGDEIGDVFSLTDLIVGRSGAGTVTEACALGKPALYVPLVPTGGDEQTRNARRSVRANAAVILPQAKCDGAHLRAILVPLLQDKPRLERMGAAARTLATPNAADDLANAILELVKGVK